MTVHRMPPETEEALERFPDIAELLDDKALGWLGRCTPDRAVEILEEIAEKGDVRNPSAFVSIAATQYPRKRGRHSEADEVFSKYPHILEQLDDVALAKLKEADPGRAAEILEDMDAKSGIRNPSAFVAKALSNFPHKRGPQAAPGAGLGNPRLSEVDEALQSLPEAVAAQLDEDAVLKLRDVDPARAVEILGDLASKGDVRNPSAFVVKALKTHPQERGPETWERKLARHPELAPLDDRAWQMLQDADPARAVEIVEDLIAKGDVRNPSAFISSALRNFPHKRGGTALPPVAPALPIIRPTSSPTPGPVPSKAPVVTMLEQALRRHQAITSALDEVALSRLREANAARAVEIIDDLAQHGTVRNPSAFVVKALNDFPLPRGPEPRGADSDLNKVLWRHPDLASKLDEAAMARLREADPERAVEILQEIVTKGDVRNPSSFVCTALNKFPHKRGPSMVESAHPSWHAVESAHPSWHAVESAHPSWHAVESAHPSWHAVESAHPSWYAVPPIVAAWGSQHTHASFASNVRSIIGAALGQPSAAPRSSSWPPSVDEMLRRIPAASRLDDVARARLREVDRERAAEILEDLDGKVDVRNPSAFVVKAIADHPYKRGRAEEPRSPSYAPAPKRHKHEGVRIFLDDVAQAKLDAADPARALEVLEELEMKGSEVRNASAFVCKSLQQFPFPRGRSS